MHRLQPSKKGLMKAFIETSLKELIGRDPTMEIGLKCKADAWMHIHVSAPPSMFFPSLWMELGWSNEKKT